MRYSVWTIAIFVLLIIGACTKDKVEVIPTCHFFDGQIGRIDNSTIVSNDGNFIICGRNGTNVFVLKISKSGKAIWRKEYSISGSATPSIIEVQNGDLYMSGTTTQLWKMNSLGDTLWTTSVGNNPNVPIVDLIETFDGNLIVVKTSEPYSTNSEICKVDANGTTLWSQLASGEFIMQVIASSNGEFITTEYNGNGLVGMKFVLSKYDANGDEIWSRSSYDLPLSTIIHSIIQLPSGELMMAGTCHYGGGMDAQGHPEPVNTSEEKFYLFKYDISGNLVFSKTYGKGNAYSIKKNEDDTFTIVGDLENETGILKIDQDGNQLWWKKTSLSTALKAVNIVKGDVNDNIITGNYKGSIFMFRTDSEGVFE